MGSTRERILDAAWQLAMQHGYRGATLARIQEQAGVHPGSFYWHFADKDSLFKALVARARVEPSVMVARLAQEADPVAAVLSVLVDNPDRYALWRFNVQLMLDPEMTDSATAAEIRGLRRQTQEMLTAAWLEHIPLRVLDAAPDLPDRLAQFSLAAVEGCVLARVADTARDERLITALAGLTMDRMVASVCEAVGEPVPEFFRGREQDLRGMLLTHDEPVSGTAIEVGPAAS